MGNSWHNDVMKSRVFRAGLVLAFAVLALPMLAHAQYASPSYSVNEIFIGSGGELEACGTDYCARQSAGDTAAGSTSGTLYQANAGFDTPSEPTLEVNVTNTNIDLGVLNNTSTAAASSNFSVKNYLSNGYVVTIEGNSPTYVSGSTTSTLDALNSPSLSAVGTEQFGINLVANTTPGIGTNPQQIPDNTFSFGTAAAGYDTPDYFKYVDGDIIAESDQSSGETQYTISIIANIATSTPGGRYQTTLVVQAIATF